MSMQRREHLLHLVRRRAWSRRERQHTKATALRAEQLHAPAKQRYALNMHSICTQHALSMHSACIQHAISMHSACNQHARTCQATDALRGHRQHAISMHSACALDVGMLASRLMRFIDDEADDLVCGATARLEVVLERLRREEQQPRA